MVINLVTVDGVDTSSHRAVTPSGCATPEPPVSSRWDHAGAAITEVADDSKPELSRRYLARWYWQVKGYVAGLTPDSSDEELRAAAPSIPVFGLGVRGDSR